MIVVSRTSASPISDYSDLQTSIAAWLHRGDLTSVIPDFIALAEAKLNRRLRLRAMENSTTGTVAQYVSLPDNYIGMRSIKVSSGSSSYPLTFVPPSEISGTNGTPNSYSIIGDVIYFEPYSSSYTYKLDYYEKFGPLSDGVNWIITNAPDVYLYASLVEAAPYIKDDERIGLYSQLLETAIADLEKSDKKDRYGSDLVVKVC